MKRHGYITDDEYKAGTSVEIKDFLDEGVSSTNEYIGFIDTVVADVIEMTGHNPYDVPMDIYTTMRKDKQDVINNFYKTYKFKNDKIQVGVAVVDVKTGALIAVGAGRNKKVQILLILLHLIIKLRDTLVVQSSLFLIMVLLLNMKI